MRKLLIVIVYYNLLSSVVNGVPGNTTYEITTGEKKVNPLQNFKSLIPYALDVTSVKQYLSQYSFKETKTTGITMILKVMQRSSIKFEYSDFDLNGKFELLKEYYDGKITSESKINENTGIILERTLFDSAGNIIEVDNDLHKKGFFTERNIYKKGKIFKTLKDLNGDGLYENEYIYFLDKKPQENNFIAKLPFAKLPSNVKCVVGGFYIQSNIATFDESLTKEVVQSLKGLLDSNYKETKSYVSLILNQEKNKKALGKKFVTRVDIYKAVNTIENKKSEKKIFIISGKVFKTDSRVTVYFRFQGPQALSTVYNGSFSQSAGEFTVAETAQYIANKLKERYVPVADEKGNRTGYKLKKVN